MPRFLNPIGRSSYGIGICDRCKKKFFLDQLTSDPNFPGLRVCSEDLDDRDPWRMAPRNVENVSLMFPRPDTVLDINDPVVTPPISLPPSSSFVIDPNDPVLVGAAPLLVSFHDLSTNNPTTWAWTITNGVDTLLSSVAHANFELTNPGVYSVTLVVSNAYGSSSYTRSNYITVT